MVSKEPPLLMNNCYINPEWERWLKDNYPNISVEATNANVFLKMLCIRASLDNVIKNTWDDYSRETMILLRECPEYWPLLQTLNPPKPTRLQRFLGIFKRK